MDGKVPITFEYEGKQINGILSPVNGAAGSNHWHLMVDSFYRGTLYYSEPYGWQYHGNSYNGMVDVFKQFVIPK